MKPQDSSKAPRSTHTDRKPVERYKNTNYNFRGEKKIPLGEKTFKKTIRMTVGPVGSEPTTSGKCSTNLTPCEHGLTPCLQSRSTKFNLWASFPGIFSDFMVVECADFSRATHVTDYKPT